MVRSCGVKAVFGAGLIAIMAVGCAERKADGYKAKVDRTAYRLIDKQWQDDFGSKANFRIDSAAPSPNDISTERILVSGTILTLPHAVAIATDHNHVYQLEKENLYVTALNLRLARHQFEPLLFGQASAGYVKDGADEAYTEGANIGIQRLLATGAHIGLNLTTSWVQVLTGNAEGGLANILTVAFSQPLLRGSDPNIVLENLTQAERDLLYQIRSFNRFRKEFVVSTISQYYRVLQMYDAAENARNYYSAIENVCTQAEKLAAAGRLPQFELDQAYQDKLIARDTFIQAEKAYKQAFDDFKLGIAVPTETEISLDYNEIVALRGMKMPMPDFSPTEAVETALARRLDLANTYDAINDAERKIVVALDSMRPGLNIVAIGDLQSKGVSNPVTLGGTKDTALIGVQFNPNLDPVPQENTYALATVILDQNRRFYEHKLDTIVLDVREAYRDLAEAADRYKVQSEQLDLARRRFENTMLLLQYARANTRDVLDAQKDLYRAKDAATDALVRYTIAMLRFYRDVEILEVRPDGMWQTAFAERIE